MIGQQLFIRLADGASFTATTAARREIAAALLDRDPVFGLLAFRVDKRYIRLVAMGDGGKELARRIEIALGRMGWAPMGFQPARADPIRDQWHLDRAVRQVLSQAGVDPSDPLAEGSNLPDLLGLRVNGLHTCAAIRQSLPRLHRAELLTALDVAMLEPSFGPIELLDDAAAAAVARASLQGRAGVVVAARRAAIEVAVQAGLRSPQVGDLLGVHPATVRRVRREPARPALVRAVALQLGLRRARLAEQLVPAT